MAVILLPATAFAVVEDEFTVSGLKFKMLTENTGNNTGTAEVILDSYTGTSYDIPAMPLKLISLDSCLSSTAHIKR